MVVRRKLHIRFKNYVIAALVMALRMGIHSIRVQVVLEVDKKYIPYEEELISFKQQQHVEVVMAQVEL